MFFSSSTSQPVICSNNRFSRRIITQTCVTYSVDASFMSSWASLHDYAVVSGLRFMAPSLWNPKKPSCESSSYGVWRLYLSVVFNLTYVTNNLPKTFSRRKRSVRCRHTWKVKGSPSSWRGILETDLHLLHWILSRLDSISVTPSKP